MGRTGLTALVVALGIVSAIPASSATPTVGGAKKASMAFSFTTTGPQQHFLAETTPNPVDSEPTDESNPSCASPRCYAFPFAVAPLTKGAKSVSASVQISWTSPASRFWLVVMDVSKDPTVVASCISYFVGAGTTATVETRLPVGHKYSVWVTVQQVLGASETVKGVLHAPAKDKPPASPLTTAPNPTGTGLGPAACQG